MARHRKAIIVGASSGIGAALSRLLVRQGYKVALVARREEALKELATSLNRNKGDRALYYPHDVTHFAEVPQLFQKITHELGGFDLIVYCAGVMPEIAPDEYNIEKDRLVFEVNVLGAMAWLNEAAARCEVQETGTIVGISSVAGDRGRKGQPVYCSSKAALNTYLEGLRNRLGHRGVKVITIKPGPVKTPMTEGLTLPFMITDEQAATGIAKAIRRGCNTTYVPFIPWFFIMTIIRMIPSFLFRGKNI
ncbi:MAG: SDR family NAD(P)-dependent oxidoreductase [Candidatus Sumerlaeia bacterium]|nr:SDR family NAD(P)-dependent oxidoreductase [Candidatus Sumerlaeia bacterium]